MGDHYLTESFMTAPKLDRLATSMNSTTGWNGFLNDS